MTKDEREFYPKQGVWLHCRVEVIFGYDTTRHYFGTVIRDDAEEPHVRIFALDDGRVVLDTECQFAPKPRRTPVAYRYHPMETRDDAARTQE